MNARVYLSNLIITAQGYRHSGKAELIDHLQGLADLVNESAVISPAQQVEFKKHFSASTDLYSAAAYINSCR